MNTKSLFKRTSRLILIGLFVSLICYPLLHELGHIFATILVGGNVKQMTLFPVPSVLCELTGISQNKRIFIGLSGGLLPVFVSLIYTPKRFYLWYANLLLRLTNVYSLCLDFIYATLFFAGLPVANTDIAEILSISQDSLLSIIFLNTISLYFLCFSIKKATPTSGILAFLK